MGGVASCAIARSHMAQLRLGARGAIVSHLVISRACRGLAAAQGDDVSGSRHSRVGSEGGVEAGTQVAMGSGMALRVARSC